MNIIGICGRTGAGKSSVVDIVKECVPQVQVISTGDAARNLLIKRGSEINHHSLQNITREILAARGHNFISFVFDLIDPTYSFTLIDSFRRIEDVDCVTKTFGPPTVIYISAPEPIRFQRIKDRARASDALTDSSFKELTSLENSWGVDKLRSYASIEIVNTQSYLVLRNSVITLFNNILSA